MKVSLVLHEFSKGWVIEKMTLKLCDALSNLGADAAVRAMPSADAAVNHFMIYHYVDVAPGTLNTMAITHVDDALKVDMIRSHLARGVRAVICMSSMTVKQLSGYGIDPRQLTYALPGHDCEIKPRRIIIGITSNNYTDGRKRDWLLTKLAKDIPLEDFEFQIFGQGWGEVRCHLEAAGAKVVIREPPLSDYENIKLAVPHFDFYFYPGLDEGSLGTLDALSAGVKTIVTSQGFHLDLPHGITHGFWDYDEMRQIFERIARERRQRVDTARSLNWQRYAQRHLDIWNLLLRKDELSPCDVLFGEVEPKAHRNYPVQTYLSLLGNKYRREMCLRFWLPPRMYQRYARVDRLISRMVRGFCRVVGKVSKSLFCNAGIGTFHQSRRQSQKLPEEKRPEPQTLQIGR